MTVEQERLNQLGITADQKGLNQRQLIEQKIAHLKERYAQLIVKNQELQPQYQLPNNVLCPDLLSLHWAQREAQRAKELVQIEFGDAFTETIKEI